MAAGQQVSNSLPDKMIRRSAEKSTSFCPPQCHYPKQPLPPPSYYLNPPYALRADATSNPPSTPRPQPCLGPATPSLVETVLSTWIIY